MRTRNRTVINETVHLNAQSLPFEESDSPGTTFTINWPANDIYTSYTDEYMSDSDTGDRVKPNPCEHKKQDVRLMSAGLADYVEASNPGHSGYATYHGRPGQWFAAARQVLGTVPWDVAREALPSRLSVVETSVDETSLLQDFLDRASGQVADHALNLAELHQLPLSLKSLRSLALPSQKNWERFRRALRMESSLRERHRVAHATIRGIVLKVANGHLAYKFGIAPLLSDIEKTWKFVKNAKAKLSKYQKGKPIRLSKTFPVTGTVDGTVVGLGAASGGKYRWEGKPSLGIFTGESRYVVLLKPNLRGPRKLLGDLNDLVNRFGPSGPTAFAWELVPFSFVVDWFVDLRSVLRGFDQLFGVNPFTVEAFTRSVTWNATAYITATHRKTDYSTIISWDSTEFKWKYYKRVVLHPRILPSLKVRFGKNQALLSASLITQFLLGLRGKGGKALIGPS